MQGMRSASSQLTSLRRPKGSSRRQMALSRSLISVSCAISRGGEAMVPIENSTSSDRTFATS
jgi:hypothetical protein